MVGIGFEQHGFCTPPALEELADEGAALDERGEELDERAELLDEGAALALDVLDALALDALDERLDDEAREELEEELDGFALDALALDGANEPDELDAPELDEDRDELDEDERDELELIEPAELLDALDEGPALEDDERELDELAPAVVPQQRIANTGRPLCCPTRKATNFLPGSGTPFDSPHAPTANTGLPERWPTSAPIRGVAALDDAPGAGGQSGAATTGLPERCPTRRPSARVAEDELDTQCPFVRIRRVYRGEFEPAKTLLARHRNPPTARGELSRRPHQRGTAGRSDGAGLLRRAGGQRNAGALCNEFVATVYGFKV